MYHKHFESPPPILVFRRPKNTLMSCHSTLSLQMLVKEQAELCIHHGKANEGHLSMGWLRVASLQSGPISYVLSIFLCSKAT